MTSDFNWKEIIIAQKYVEVKRKKKEIKEEGFGLPVEVTTSQFSLPKAPSLNPPGRERLLASWTGLSFQIYSTSLFAQPSKNRKWYEHTTNCINIGVSIIYPLSIYNTYSSQCLGCMSVHQEEREQDTWSRSRWGRSWCCREHRHQGTLGCKGWEWEYCEMNQFSHFWRMCQASKLCWHPSVLNILFSLKFKIVQKFLRFSNFKLPARPPLSLLLKLSLLSFHCCLIVIWKLYSWND